MSAIKWVRSNPGHAFLLLAACILIVAALIDVASGPRPERYMRLACDAGTGRAYLIRFAGDDAVSADRQPDADPDCRARMHIADPPTE